MLNIDARAANLKENRSRLYRLEPIGLGTPLSESLSSYIMRLANEHNIKLRDLLFYEVYPLLSERHDYFLKYIKKCVFNYSRLVDGTGPLALDFIDALEKLTRRNDLSFLTLVHWKGILKRRATDYHIKWCKICLEDWRNEGRIIYQPLIWSVSTVTRCTIHNTTLSNSCSECGKNQFSLNTRSRSGYCTKCDKWLGEGDTIVTSSQVGGNIEEWVTSLVGELISKAPQLKNCPTNMISRNIICDLEEKLTNGNLSELSRVLNINFSRLSRWKHGRVDMSPELLFKLLRQINVPISILYSYDDVCFNSIEINKGIEVKSENDYRIVVDNIEEIREKVSKLLKIHPPLTFNEIKKNTNYSTATLNVYAGDICRQISKNRSRYLIERKKLRKADLYNKIKEFSLNYIKVNNDFPDEHTIRNNLESFFSLEDNKILLEVKEELIKNGVWS